MSRFGRAPVTLMQALWVLSPLAFDLHLSESQNDSVPLEHNFSLEFFSPFGVYMNWLNPSRGESVFTFAKALPGEVLFVQRSPYLLGLAAAPRWGFSSSS